MPLIQGCQVMVLSTLLSHPRLQRQLSKVQEEAIKYPNAGITWCQEESKNGGAWSYARPRIVTSTRDVRDIRPVYAGRGPAAATSTGSAAQHKRELDAMMEQAFA